MSRLVEEIRPTNLVGRVKTNGENIPFESQRVVLSRIAWASRRSNPQVRLLAVGAGCGRSRVPDRDQGIRLLC